MTMPRASASLIPDHDSVENEKDLAKFKVDKDLVGEEHNTDSVENDKDFAKSNDLVGEEEEDNTPVPMSQDSAAAAAMELEAFNLWRQVYGIVYKNKDEEAFRFMMFKNALDLTGPPGFEGGGFPSMADRTEEEVEEYIESNGLPYFDNHITRQHIILFQRYLAYKVKFPELADPAAAAMKFTPDEAFKIWRKVYPKEYRDQDEEDLRFDMFQRALNMDKPPSYCGVSFPSLADRTEELKEFRELMGCRLIIIYPSNTSFGSKTSLPLQCQKITFLKDNTPFPTHPIDPKVQFVQESSC